MKCQLVVLEIRMIHKALETSYIMLLVPPSHEPIGHDVDGQVSCNNYDEFQRQHNIQSTMKRFSWVCDALGHYFSSCITTPLPTSEEIALN